MVEVFVLVGGLAMTILLITLFMAIEEGAKLYATIERKDRYIEELEAKLKEMEEKEN